MYLHKFSQRTDQGTRYRRILAERTVILRKREVVLTLFVNGEDISVKAN